MNNPQNNLMQKMQKVTECLRQCGYSNINEVNQQCYQVLCNYPNLTPITVQRNEMNCVRTVLELYGDVSIMFKNNQYPIVTHIFFPQLFPTAPPQIRIKNVDPSQFEVGSKYMLNYNANDGFVHLQLSETQNWGQHRSTIKLMNQTVYELGQVFPFYKRKDPVVNQQQPQQPYNNQNQNFNQQPGYNPNMNYQNVNNQQYQNVNNQQYQNQGNQGAYNNFQNQNQGQNQGTFNNQQKPTNILPNQNQNQPQKQNPVIGQLQSKIQIELELEAKKIYADIKELKKTFDQINDQKSLIDQQEIQLIQGEKELILKNKLIDEEILKLQQYIQSNNEFSLNHENVGQYLQESDPLSLQIINLVSENKAIIDARLCVENQFKQEKIDLDQTLQLIKDFSQQEFYNKEVLKKCISFAKSK